MPATLINDGKAVQLSHPQSGSTAEIQLCGATITSWKVGGNSLGGGVEKLYLSSKAALDGTAAIRGGVPVVFPVFGSAKDHAKEGDIEGLEKLPKHGFARTEVWELSQDSDGTMDNEAGVTAKFVLKTSHRPNLAAVYEWPCELRYTVTLSASSLTSHLRVSHLSSSDSGSNKPMRFQALLHNYLRVPDATKAGVVGLDGLYYIDKTAGFAEVKESNAEIRPCGHETDRVYVGGSGSGSASGSAEGPSSVSGQDQSGKDGHALAFRANYLTLKYNSGLLDDPLNRHGSGIEIKRSATLKDVTVWNPAEKAGDGIADLDRGGWKHFVCVEPGYVAKFVELPAGEQWDAQQILSAI